MSPMLMSSKADFDVRTDLKKRTIFTRMTGVFSEGDMQAWAKEYREATDCFQGSKHMVIADMRGMKTVDSTVAAILGEGIAYARKRGVVLCAHVSDDTAQRLQARGIARRNSASDDVTVEVASAEEGLKVVEEARSRIDDESPASSIRAAI
jgi:hypothetical protein